MKKDSSSPVRTDAPGNLEKASGWTSDDSFFGPAYIDMDEWRENPVPHRYVHGGFSGTDTRFSFYFPPADIYQGRLFHQIEGGIGGSECAVQHSLPQAVVPEHVMECAFDLGAYLIESNQGHIDDDLSGGNDDSSILCWRASAQAARFSKVVAECVYGNPPHHGYAFGGSGGGIRSLNCLENVEDVWDGGIPYLMPHQSQGTFFSQQFNAVRALGHDKMDAMADAVEVGGSGDPFAGLDSEQTDALKALYHAGFPRGVSLKDDYSSVITWTWFPSLFDEQDPTYFDEFWTEPGYLGHDHPEQIQKDRVRVTSRVRRILTAEEVAGYQPQAVVVDAFGIGEQGRSFALRQPAKRPYGIVLEDGEPSKMGCASLRFTSGAGVGRNIQILSVLGDVLIGNGVGEQLYEGVRVGDEVTIDNSRYLAFCFYHRHQVQPRFPEWGYLIKDGQPIYPQRKLFTVKFAHRYTYQLGARKVILVAGLKDRGTWPCGPVSYREQLAKTTGSDSNCRIWFNENMQHGNGSEYSVEQAPVPTTQWIDFPGMIHCALRALVGWVEQDVEPPASSQFDYTKDHEVILAPTADARQGVQPVVSVRANGDAGRTNVGIDTSVEFEVTAEAIPGMGIIVGVEWDFDGSGNWPYRINTVEGNSPRVHLKTTHAFLKAGTYFAACRVTAQAGTQPDSPLYRLPNLGRIRVVVA